MRAVVVMFVGPRTMPVREGAVHTDQRREIGRVVRRSAWRSGPVLDVDVVGLQLLRCAVDAGSFVSLTLTLESKNRFDAGQDVRSSRASRSARLTGCRPEYWGVL
jgi:hypothetical protein